MNQLIQVGLAKTKKEVKIKQNAKKVMQRALIVKDIVSLAI